MSRRIGSALRALWTIGVLGIAFASCAAAARAQGAPKLVVFISVDQMRFDYLTRFADLYRGGFARLMERGAVFTDAHQAHALTGTAPGHATLATGVFPARHGIPSNIFFDREARRVKYAAEDDDARILGIPADTGRSPVLLERDVVGDWLKRSSPDSKVYAVAVKDRVAVLLGGRRPDAAYWYHMPTGRFVTSDYYRDDYPEWVTAFNDADYPSQYFATGWSKLLDDSVYARSHEDDFPAEGNGGPNTFPHAVVRTDSLALPPHAELTVTPFADEVSLMFARALIREEALGQDLVPDFLAIGIAGGDLIGHDYGPYSQEIQDFYLRLDRYLGELFDWLDREVREYAVVLSADHGAPMTPEENARRGVQGGRVSLRDLQPVFVPELQRALFDLRIDVRPSISFLFPFGLTMAFPEGAVPDAQQAELRRRIAASLKTADWADDTFTYDELADRETPDRPYLEMYRRSFVPHRAPDVMVHFKRHYYFGDLVVDHGTPYDYDTHVPIIFMGPGIESGRHDERVRTVDVAPTVARLLGVPAPPDLDGVVLESVLP